MPCLTINVTASVYYIKVMLFINIRRANNQ